MNENVPTLEEQIEELANFIMADVPGEPSQDEGAVDCAIRIIKERGEALSKILTIWATSYGRDAANDLAEIAAIARKTLHVNEQ